MLYGELFYRANGSDVGFDREFSTAAAKLLRLRAMNVPLLVSLDAVGLDSRTDALAAAPVA